MRIDTDPKQTFDPDCSTCRHRAVRHPSRRTEPCKPRRHDYVCMVLGRAIGEHGTYMQRWLNDKGEFLCSSVWTWDVPCRKFDKKTGEWYPLDYDPTDGYHGAITYEGGEHADGGPEESQGEVGCQDHGVHVPPQAQGGQGRHREAQERSEQDRLPEGACQEGHKRRINRKRNKGGE